MFQWDWDSPGPSQLQPEKMQKLFQLYYRNNVKAYNAEMSNNWGPRGLGYYLLANLLWDVNSDLRALMEDFYKSAFGPSERPMKRYYDRWYSPNKPRFSRDPRKCLKDDYRDLDQAVRLARDDPAVMARLDHLRMYLHWLLLREHWKEAGKKKNKSAFLKALEAETRFAARLTYTNMIHCDPLLGKAFTRRLGSYGNLVSGVNTREWRKVSEDIPSHEEVERFWTADKKELGVR